MRSQESKYKYIRGLNIEPGNTAFLKKKKKRKKKARAIKRNQKKKLKTHSIIQKAKERKASKTGLSVKPNAAISTEIKKEN